MNTCSTCAHATIKGKSVKCAANICKTNGKPISVWLSFRCNLWKGVSR